MRTSRIPIVLAIAATLMAARVVSAHASLMRSDPPANSVQATAPAKVTIWFTEPIEPGFSTITVLFEDGSKADQGDNLVSSSDGTQLSVSLADSREGTYLVSWRVLSAVDGHITSGSFVYSVGEAITRPAGAAAGGAVTSPLDMLARALNYVGQALLVGVMLFRWLVWRPALKSAELSEEVDERATHRTRLVVYVALGLTAAGMLLALLAQSALAGATITGWLSTRVGRIWIGRAATLLALGVLSDEIATAGRPQPGKRLSTIALNVAVLWLGLQLLLTTSLTSHSASITTPPFVPLVADWLHLIGTAVWVGGLAQMAFVVPAVAKTLGDEDRAWLWLRTVVHFSTVAAAALGVLLVTGAYMSMLHVGDWAALLSTAYGRALLLKLALAGAAMLLGAFNLFIIKPRLDRAVDQPADGSAHALHRRFRRIVAVEAVFALAVLAAAGILTNLPRSRDPQPVADGGPLELATRADDLDGTLTIDPALEGDNTFALRLAHAGSGEPVTDAGQVTLRFTYLARSLGMSSAEATLTPDGAYATSGAFLSLPGDWQIEAAVRRPDAFDAFAAYRVKVGLDGRIAPAGEPTLVESIARWLSIYGLAFGGFVAIALGFAWLAIGAKASRNLASLALLAIPSLIALPVGALSVYTFFKEATPGLSLTNPYLPDEQSLAIGQQLFEANCATCHGSAGRGNGPRAGELPVRPADFGSGHLDIHTDGDIFYWIQNGLPARVASPMPAFKDVLTEDETWHVVNYVRRLRNLAGAAPTAITVGVTPQPPTPAASGDPAALERLIRADAAMNVLRSLVEKQSLRDDAGNQLDIVFTYAAPDRMRYQVVNGATAIQIGSSDFQLTPDGTWIENRRAVPLEWPEFNYSSLAGEARIEGEEQIGESAATVVAFRYGGFDFRMWIDQGTDRIIRLSMDGPNHHMVSAYSEFDSAPPIERPTP
ncbi:MAG TPA: CopD family protein [Anaerolineae bacterium]|nr:CopD family protein [Anaerolineae bacterium]